MARRSRCLFASRAVGAVAGQGRAAATVSGYRARLARFSTCRRLEATGGTHCATVATELISCLTCGALSAGCVARCATRRQGAGRTATSPGRRLVRARSTSLAARAADVLARRTRRARPCGSLTRRATTGHSATCARSSSGHCVLSRRTGYTVASRKRGGRGAGSARRAHASRSRAHGASRTTGSTCRGTQRPG